MWGRPRAILVAILLTAGIALAQDAPRQHAPIALHPDNGHYLIFRGKPAVLIGSTEHYGAVLNSDFDFAAYLEELSTDGLNLTRAFSGTYFEVPSSFGITDNTLAPKRESYVGPWARTDTPGAADGGNKFDLTKFDPRYFERLKAFIAEASKRGVVVEYVLFCPFYEDSLFAVNPMNAANNVNNVGAIPRTEAYTLKHPDLLGLQLAFVRKAVEELRDFDNLFYEICNEPYFGGVTLEWQARIAREIVDAEKKFLPDGRRHLIAQNIANGGKKIEKPDPNVSIFNFHYATPPDTVEQNYALNKVLGDDETGFKGSADVTYRTEGWDFLIAGGAVYDHLDYSFSVKHPRGTFSGYKSPGGGSKALRQQLGTLKRFMESFDLVRMKPMNEIVKGGSSKAAIVPGKPASSRVTVRVLGEEGKQYAVYVRGGSACELVLVLTKGNYKAEWLNPASGQIDKADTIEHGGGPVTLKSPDYQDDVAVRIKVTQ